MSRWLQGLGSVLVGLSIVTGVASAKDDPGPELQKAMDFFATAGVPGDKWVEGENYA